jgi:GT2 family glycosyltransferase
MADAERSVLPSVTVVVPAYNCADVIGAQLEALSVQSYPGHFDVVVSDNRSVDSLAEVVDSFRDRLDVRRVAAFEKQGVSHARNVGCRATDSDVIAICDADDVADTRWLEMMVAGLVEADLVGGRREVGMLNAGLPLWREAPKQALSAPLSFLPYPNGANVAMRRAVFEDVGGWDEDLVAGGDDVDFAWRAQLAGFSTQFVPDALVHYRYRESVCDTVRQVYRYNLTRAALLVRFRRHGAKADDLSKVLGDLAWLASRSPYLLCLGSWRRGRWLVKAAGFWGRFRGSVRHRVWAM